MPLNGALATITKETFDLKLEAAKKKLFVDTAFWGGLTQDNVLLSEDGANVEDLKMLLSSGVAGVKSFLNPAGFIVCPASCPDGASPSRRLSARCTP